MAKGYPDYFGMSTFPQFGPIQKTRDTGTIASAAQDEIIRLSGKGNMLGGIIFFDAITNISNVQIVTKFAAGPDSWMPLGTLVMQGGMNPLSTYPLRMLVYSLKHHHAALHFNADYNFGTDFVLEVLNGSGGDLAYVSEIYWSKII